MFTYIVKMLILLILALTIDAVAVDIDLSVDKTGWVDPSDPLTPFLTNSNTADLIDGTESAKQCECSDIIEDNRKLREQLNALQLARRENSVDVLMKHVLRQFLAKLDIDLAKIDGQESIFKKAQVSLSAHDLSVIRRYLASEKTVEEIAIREDLRGALEHFLIETDIRSDNSLLSFLHSLLPFIMLFNVIILLPALIIVLRSACSLPRFLMLLLTSAFALSCYFTYIRKYQEVLALRIERSDRLGQNGKHPCSPQGLVSEALDLMLSYVTLKDKSECLKSYEDVLIEPFLLVDPLQVLAEVLSNFFLSPLSVAGVHLNQFFRHFYANIPIQLALVMTIFVFSMPPLMLWVILRIREHFARERRQEEQHYLMQSQNQQKQLAAATTSNEKGNNPRIVDKAAENEHERKIRRRALGHDSRDQQKRPAPNPHRNPSSSSDQEFDVIRRPTTTASLSGNEYNSADDESSFHLHAIRKRVEERRKYE